MNNKISNQPSSCEDFEILISAMVDGELERAELAELQSHLDLCSGCRTTISDFETINLAVAVNVESSADSSHSEQTVVKKPVAKTVRLARSGWMSAWRLIPLAAAATIVVCLAITAIPNPKPATAEQISPPAICSTHERTPLHQPAAAARPRAHASHTENGFAFFETGNQST